jgi:hypothetical protein
MTPRLSYITTDMIHVYNEIKDYTYDMGNYDRFATYKEFEIRKDGICYDYANYIYHKLSKYKPKSYLFILDNIQYGTYYHAITVLNNIDLWYMECAYKDFAQIKSYKNLTDIFDTVVDYMIRTFYGNKRNVFTHIIEYIPDNKRWKYENNCKSFIKHVEKTGITRRIK